MRQALKMISNPILYLFRASVVSSGAFRARTKPIGQQPARKWMLFAQYLKTTKNT
jgi:hypothetical protein